MIRESSIWRWAWRRVKKPNRKRQYQDDNAVRLTWTGISGCSFAGSSAPWKTVHFLRLWSRPELHSGTSGLPNRGAAHSRLEFAKVYWLNYSFQDNRKLYILSRKKAHSYAITLFIIKGWVSNYTHYWTLRHICRIKMLSDSWVIFLISLNWT